MNTVKLAVDAVVFGYQQNLKILLIKRKYAPYKEYWALPGGFVLDNENLEEAVVRELAEEAGVNLELNYLEQLYTFGSLGRDERGRVVSVAYMGIVNPEHHTISASADALEARWFNWNEIHDIPLAFDHRAMLKKALERLKAKLSYQPIGFDLLPDTFLFSQLEHIYQSILERDIDRRNFRKKFMSFDLLEETGELHSVGKGRPAMLFRFNKDKYENLVNEGFNFQIL